MATLETTLGKLEVFFGGATVFAALIFLFVVGQIVLSGETTSPGAVLALATVVLICALVVGTGMWYQRRWVRVASWPATVVLVALGFVGTAIGPQIIGVAAFALLATVVMTARDYFERDASTHGQAA